MSQNSITIQETQVTNYKLRGNHSWADIVIEIPREGAVQVLINSDYGHWAYFWGAVGSDWRSFLSKIDRHYMASKFGCNRHFDSEGTLKMYINRINEAVLNGDITDEASRDCTDSVKEIIENSPSAESFQSDVFNSDCFNWMYDGSPEVLETIDPGFNTFYDTFWKEFCAYITEAVQEKEVA